MRVERVARTMAWGELRGRDKGLRGSSSTWLAIWVVTVAYRYLRKWTTPDPVIVREVLLPGQQLVVSHFPEGAEPPAPEPLSKRRRRARRKAGREAEASSAD